MRIDTQDGSIHPLVTQKGKITYKTKKRQRNVEQWIDVRRKLLTNSGKEYISKAGKRVPAKTMKEPCHSGCKLKCSTIFSEKNRKEIFSQFWQLADRPRQWEYINKFTRKVQTKRTKTDGSSKRTCTVKYYLPLFSDDSAFEYQLVQVCRTMFRATLSITEAIVRTAHVKLDDCGVTYSDNRGKFPKSTKQSKKIKK